MPLPQDLVRLETDLEAEFTAESGDVERRARLGRLISKRRRR